MTWAAARLKNFNIYIKNKLSFMDKHPALFKTPDQHKQLNNKSDNRPLLVLYIKLISASTKTNSS